MLKKLALLALVFIFSCSSDNGNVVNENVTPVVRKEKISGVSQKGPFTEGATVKIYELDANKNKTEKFFLGETDGNGNFEVEINGTLASPYILLEASGNYVSEVSGEQSNTPITLYAVADVSGKDNVNINVFTHLEHERVLSLAKSIDFGAAKKEAQKKMLVALGMEESNANSEDMSLFGSSANDAKLLAASVLLQANRQAGAVRDLLATISGKIKDNEALSQSTKTELANGATWVSSNISEVERNIRNLDENAQVPSLATIDDIVTGINNAPPPSSSSSPSSPSSSSTDNGSVIYEGKTYKTVKIGEQVWMAENLNYNASGSKCHGNSTANCDIYGRLYDWATAMEVCPSGWHLPNNADWDTLVSYVGGAATAGTKLKARNGWNESGNGTDDFGFAALPGGSRLFSDDEFYGLGEYGDWWSATSVDSTGDIAYYQEIRNNSPGASLNDDGAKNAFNSVRCLKD